MNLTRAQTFIGCISGTSVDGLDVAALDIDDNGRISFRAAQTYPIADDLRAQLLALGQPDNDDIDQLGHADAQLGELTGVTINAFIAEHNLQPTAIGNHGQTVRHRPGQQYGFTLQIGDANRIAEITGVTTVADFRRRDMAAGGEGAPLVPPFHQELFASAGRAPVVLNIGGISNVSILGDPVRGFDTGPGNGLLDAWCDRHTGQPFDDGGAWASGGRTDEALLQRLLADPFFAMTPPKSTGREYFNLPWLDKLLSDNATSPQNVQATLVDLTARCTADALAEWGDDYSNLIVCGGGRLNHHLMERLAHFATGNVQASEHFGVNGDAIEAGLFAWLAYRTLAGLPGNAAAVTGAADARVLGAIYTGATP